MVKIHIITIIKTISGLTIIKVTGIGLMVDIMLEFLYITIVLITILTIEITIPEEELCIIATIIKTIVRSPVF